MSIGYYYDGRSNNKSFIKARWTCKKCGSIDWNEHKCEKCGAIFCAANRKMTWFDNEKELQDYKDNLKGDLK